MWRRVCIVSVCPPNPSGHFAFLACEQKGSVIAQRREQAARIDPEEAIATFWGLCGFEEILTPWLKGFVFDFFGLLFFFLTVTFLAFGIYLSLSFTKLLTRRLHLSSQGAINVKFLAKS